MSQAATAQPDKRRAIERLADAPDDVKREVCREDFRIFSNLLTYNWIEGNDAAGWHGKPFDWYPTPQHFADWWDRIRRFDLNMFLAARKHTKTTFADCLMAFRSEYRDGHTSLYWANTENQVKERLEEFDELIAANPWLEHLHTDTALLRKEYDNGSRIRTTWVQGAAEGGHVDLSLGDDPMKEFADIPDTRIEEWYGKVIVPMLNPDGLHAIIGTRKRPNDLYELLRAKHENDDALAHLPSYTLAEYPAIREAWVSEYDRPSDLASMDCYTPTDAPLLADALGLDTDRPHILWPDARPPEWLGKNLGAQGRSYFVREFCMVFRQVEDAIVQRSWIQRTADDRAPPADLQDAWQPADYPASIARPEFDRVVVGHDPAGAGRDRFAFVTVGAAVHPPEAIPDRFRWLAQDEDGEPVPVRIRHILDAWQARDVPPSRWRAKLTSLHDRYEPEQIAIESNLNATWTADDDEIPDRVRRRIRPIATTRRKHSWKDGVPAIATDIEAGRYRFYTGGGEDNQTGDLVTALTSIQMHEGELVGHTPDLVMALFMAHKALATGSGGVVDLNERAMTDAERDRYERDREHHAETVAKLEESGEVGEAILAQHEHLQENLR